MKKMTEFWVVLAMLIVMAFKIDPFHWFMPDNVQMIILCLLVAGLFLWIGLLFREHARDERESFHLYRASRAGFVVGVVAFSVLIVIQDLQHRLDPLLLVALAAMIITKLMVLIISRRGDEE